MSSVEASDALHRRVVEFARACTRDELGALERARHFDELAVAIARFQAEHCGGHRHRCGERGPLRRVDELRPLPVDAFRFSDVYCFEPARRAACFRTSGTTRAQTGRHFMRTTETYRTLSTLGAEGALLPMRGFERAPWVIALLAAPGESPSSSLGTMVRWLMERWSADERGMGAVANQRWLLDASGVSVEGFERSVAAAHAARRPVYLFATSFALVMLLDALGARRVPLPAGSIIVQTGGFKGRTRELSAAELTQRTHEALAPVCIVGEYGMTELSSQLYTSGAPGSSLQAVAGGQPREVYFPPPWLRVQALDPSTLTPLEAGGVGLASFIDLGNVDSAVYVVTEDLISLEGSGVRLHGRRPRAPLRGCSLAAEAIWSAQLDPPQPFTVGPAVPEREPNSVASKGAHGRGGEPAALERIGRLLDGARALRDARHPRGVRLREALLGTTSLSAQAVELALLSSLETEPTPFELERLCARMKRAPRVWVLLSANVFVAAHRAIACALAASPEVIVRPSRREPAMARALHEATGDLFSIAEELRPSPGDHVHAYASDETIALLAQQLPPGVVLFAHASGIGAGLVLGAADLDQVARGFALDTVLFEQRGCASPRVIGVGEGVDAHALCAALIRELGVFATRVPVLPPPEAERADATWFSALAEFCAEHHRVDRNEPALGSVSLQRAAQVPIVPPVGRNVVVFTSDDCVGTFAPFEPVLTCIAVAGDGPARERVARTFRSARICEPGAMQRPPLDGPLDLRPWGEPHQPSPSASLGAMGT